MKQDFILTDKKGKKKAPTQERHNGYLTLMVILI